MGPWIKGYLTAFIGSEVAATLCDPGVCGFMEGGRK
jgi:hypothetical protein